MIKWIRNHFRKWFRRDAQTPEPVMVNQIVTRRSARLVYQRRNGIEPLMAPVKSRRRHVTR